MSTHSLTPTADVEQFGTSNKVVDNDTKEANMSSSQQQQHSPSPTLTSHVKPLPLSDTMSTPRKIFITFVLCMMTLSLTFNSTAYASSSAHLIEHFHSSQEVILLGVALFVLGFAVGPLLFGPMAHLIGFRPVYIGTYICFTAFAFGAAEAGNIQTLIIMRFLSGVFGSSSLNNVPASIGQYVAPALQGKFMIFYALSAFGGPGLGPVIAAFVDHRAGFRWNLRVQAIFVAITTIACILFVPETGAPVLRQKKQEASKEKEGQVEPSKRAFVVATIKRALIGPFKWLLTEPVVAVICVYLSLLYGILYGFFEVFPYVFGDIRHWSEESVGLIFISLLVGFFGALFVIAVPQQRYEFKIRARLEKGQTFPPEAKLQQMLWAAALPPIGLFIFAWTAPFPHVHWIGPAIGMAVFALGMMVIFTSLIPYLVLYAGPEAPLVLAAGTCTRASFGAGFPLFSLQMYKKLTVQGASSLLAGLALLLVPFPFILIRYGPALRAKSRRAT